MVAIAFLIICAVVILGAALTFALSKNSRNSDEIRSASMGVGIIGLVVGLVIYAVASISIVPARTVGVVTEFGQSVGTAQNGFNWLSPWSEVTEFPTTNQSYDRDATDSTPENPGKVITIAFSGGGTGFVNMTVVYRVEDNEKVQALWQAWKEFEKIEPMIVDPAVTTATGQVVGGYEPQEARSSENWPVIATEVKSKAQTELAKYGILIESVFVKKIDVDSIAQGRIDAFTASQGNTKVAEQDQKTARIQAKTDKIRESSLTPGALQAKCLEITAAWDTAKNGPLPANWNCSSAEGLALAVPVK